MTSDVNRAFWDERVPIHTASDEHEHTSFERWPFLEKSGWRNWRMPDGRPRLPLTYSLRARRP
jgi:hypothetical protein